MTSSGLFAGERALVTGSASNIGRAIALALAAEGADLLLADIDDARNGEVAREARALGRRAEPVAADLSTGDGWRAVIGACGERPPEMMVYSACPRRYEKDTPLAVEEATLDAMLTTNVRSAFLLGRDLGRRMRTAGVAGRMLYITSLHAEAPRNLAHYSAGKAGMTMVMKELARALGPHGIRVNALAPGAVPGGGAVNMDDRFGPKRKIPMQRFGTAADMAGPAVALLANRYSGYVTGTTLAVDGGLALFNWIDLAEG
jgi:NAD(P)-dependent dehydrogenase (short-subunit alcohol dehydrogenase family)